MFCKHNFTDNVGRQKNWVACSFHLQVYYEHKNRFKVLVLNIFFLFYYRQNINAELRKFDIADRYTSFMLLVQLAPDKNLSYTN